MSDYHRPVEWRKARKPHRCEWCFHLIAIGERHGVRSGFYEGLAYRYRTHVECDAELVETAEYDGGEFTPGIGDPPARLLPPSLTDQDAVAKALAAIQQHAGAPT